jgi:hydrogenase maturation protease
LRHAAHACRNQGTWPVLVGDDGEQPPSGGSFGHTVLSSPITLYDFPQVAPESPGDLFDGTEIDQLLILSVLSMSEEEQQEMAACDPRARAILERCAALTPDDLMALHGAIRSRRPLEDR